MILSCPNCDTKFRVKDDAIGPKGRKVKCRNCAHTWHAMPDTGGDPAPAAAAAAPPPPPPPQPAPAPVVEEAPAPPPPPQPTPAPEPAPAPEIPADAPPIPGPDPVDAGAPPAPSEPPPIPPGEDFVLRQRKPKVEKKSPLMAWVILILLVIVTAAVGIFMQKEIVKAYPPIAKVYGMIGIDTDLTGYGLELPDPTLSVAERSDEGTKLIFTGQIITTLDEETDLPLLRGALVDSNNQELHVWFFEPSKPNILPGEVVEYTTEVINPPQGAVKADIRFVERSAEGMMEEDAMMDGDGAETN